MNLFPIWRENARFPSRRAPGALALLAFVIVALAAPPAEAQDEKVLVAFGDSLTAGYQLAPEDAFPAQLERALKDRGHAVRVVNAGVSGDTASAGLARLDWAVPPEADAVILELGANDALRGLDPQETRAALDAILTRLGERGLPVLLAGMMAPRNMGPEYEEAFNAIYPELAEKHGAVFHAFFLDGVATVRSLNLGDGIHPNAEGVAVIVGNMLSRVEALLERVGVNSAARG